MASDWEGLSIAPNDDMLTASPTWERIDDVAGCRVSEIEVRSGRSDEFERTDTGSMVVSFNDREGIVDPTNAADLVSRPIALALRDPETDEWFSRWRGVVESVACEMDESQGLLRTTITAVDWFDYLAGVELIPGLHGTATDEGEVLYEHTVGTIDDRFTQILTELSFPAGLRAIFTGNVRGEDDIYSAGESALTALRNAADAEFPTVANLFCDRYGFLCFHGRYARFDPFGVSGSASHWDFHRWKAGDGIALQADDERAQLRPPFAYVESRAMIRNAALCYPKVMREDAPLVMEDQIRKDLTSIGAHGVRSWSSTDLVIKDAPTTGNDKFEECQLFADYIVQNYAEPVPRIDQLTVLAIHPDGSERSVRTWAMLMQADINDLVEVAISTPGGGGFVQVEFYVEGLNYRIRPASKDLDTGYPMITASLTTSPAAYWASNPFGPFS